MKILAIVGPTATGKTDLALQLAKKWNGELVACDSRQVYKGLDIGTGKAPSGDGKWEVRSEKMKWQLGGINIWMYDVVDPKVQYTVADYVKDASKVIDEIYKKGKLPIVVGGTGLYLKALLKGLPNLAVPIDRQLRRGLEKLSLGELQEKLKSLSPAKWQSLNDSDRQNPRRLLRAIELESTYGFTVSDKRYAISDRFDSLKIGLTAPREQLYKRIDLRVLSRIDRGMVDEARSLYRNGLTLKRMRQLGLEYGVLAEYLEGQFKTLDEMITVMQNKIHSYVRRQLTWFKKEPQINWFDVTNPGYINTIEKLIAKWYDS